MWGLVVSLKPFLRRVLFPALLASLFPALVAAQVPTYTSPQTVQQVLAPAGTACTGTTQTFTVTNLGQTQHYAYIKTTSVQTLVMQFFGVDSAGNQFLISDTASTGAPAFGATPSLAATGYYPKVQVVLTCTPATTGTFILSYTGTSSTSNVNAGGYELAQIDKVIGIGANAGTNLGVTFQPPFGSSFGSMIFNPSGAIPAGSELEVSCFGVGAGGGPPLTYTLATTGLQIFNVPASSCPVADISFAANGVSGQTFGLDYVFSQPGQTLTNSYTHITGTTATEVKPGSGILHSVVVGTPAAGTISLFDLAPASCTATPSTNVVSVITATATFPAAPEIYDVLFQNGICVKASAAMDFTLTYQ